MTRGRQFLIVASLALLTGCNGGSRQSDYPSFYKLMRQSWRNSFSGGVSREQAAAIPYASMGWRLNGGPQQIIILATDSGQSMIWTSAAHIVLQTESGRITRTVGLPVDLQALANRSGSALSTPSRALGGPYSEQRITDIPAKGIYNAIVTCRAHRNGRQSIKILGRAQSVERIDEDCVAPAMSWTFTDTYWLDHDTGMAWRSRQHLNPDTVLETEMFRPPG